MTAGIHCAACGSVFSPGQKFCGECGARLLPEAMPGADTEFGGVGGERKQVTILFCDIVGSTPLAAKLGADRMHRVLNEFMPVAEAFVRQYDGNVNQFLGDGFMALFGAPIMHEDHARRAALAAMAIRDAVAVRVWSTMPADEQLRIRIGLNSGPVVFGRVGDKEGASATAIGDTANVAARLQTEAQPGQVVCSASLAKATSAFVESRSLGARKVKGKFEPIGVFELVASRPTQALQAPAGLDARAKMVGRGSEWAALKVAVERLCSGPGGIVTIVGEAGLGKSRLLAETHLLALTNGTRWVQGTCVSYGKSNSYLPFRALMSGALGIADDEVEASALQKVASAIGDLFGAAAADITPFVSLLLGLHPQGAGAQRLQALEGQATGHQIFFTSLRVVERLAQARPLAFVLDDWQWADSSSAALLQHLLPLALKLPILFVVAYRPDGDSGSGAGLADALRADQGLAGLHGAITLVPLDQAAARQHLIQLLPPGPVPAPLEAYLLRRAGGNPFYLEELVRTLVATEVIERDHSSGVWRASGHLDANLLPDRIEGVILARVDRLDSRAKQLLKLAAVIGRSFSLRVLVAVTQAHPDLAGDLATLKTAELLVGAPNAREPGFVFCHPLIQQAVYDSLLEEQRRKLHGEVGAAFLQLFADRSQEIYPVLAHHFACAQDWERAQEYLFLAGSEAGRIAADTEALELYNSALRAATASARSVDRVRRAQLATRMAEALYRLGRNEAALKHALEALAGLGFAYPVTPQATYLAIVRTLLGRSVRRVLRPFHPAGLGGARPADPAYLTASQLFEVIGSIDYFLHPARFALDILTMLDEAERRPLSRGLAISTASLGLITDTLGLYRIGAMLHRRALRAARQLDDRLALGYSLHMHGLHQYSSGDWAGALETLDAGSRQLDAAGHLRWWASCTGATYFVLRSMGDPRWMELAIRQLEVGTAIGDDHVIAWGINATGVAHLYRGNHVAAISLFEKASLAYEAIPDYRFLAGACARRALCHALAGQVDAAIGLLARCESLIKDYRMIGMSASAPVLVSADAYLCLAERIGDASRRHSMLRQAAAACSRAARHGRAVHDESAAEARRLQGVHAWLNGNRARAQRLWHAAIHIAQTMGASYVLARTHHEIALRTGDQTHAVRARESFEKAGAAPFNEAGSAG